MIVQMVGCSHHTCPIDVRERMAVTGERVPEFLTHWQARFPDSEAVLLSTCNRTELYTAAWNRHRAPSHGEAIAFFSERQGVPQRVLETRLSQRSNVDAIRHLFTVAASLDSMVLGETQILAQVKAAYQLACQQSSAGLLTHAAFQAAIRTARRIARETELHRHRVSIASLAVRDCGGQAFERLADKRIAVIGAGKMAMETLKCLQSEGAQRIRIVNRDPLKATALAAQYHGVQVPWEHLPQLFAEVDLLVSSTGADEPIVRLEAFRSWIAPRSQRPLLILDLAVPRDFDPQIAHCRGVSLYSIDDLKHLSAEHTRLREHELRLAQRIVQEETDRYWSFVAGRSTVPAMQRLAEAARVLKASELDRLFRKRPDLEPGTRREIERMVDRFANKLLHPLRGILRGESPVDGTAEMRRRLQGFLDEDP